MYTAKFMSRIAVIFLGLCLAAGWFAGTRTAHAATLPAGFSESVVAGGLSKPTAMAFSSDGRIFVTLQEGALRVVKNNALLPTPFVSITTTATGERGLLGVALHPGFPATPYVYVYYTVPGTPAHNRLSRFTANGDVAQAGSEQILVEFENLTTQTNHNGGALHFGPDNKLYVAVGENANPNHAETLANKLGKILRYNDDGTIPTDNPFHDGNGPNADAIWAYGLRNPFTFGFQPGTGRMFVNDVGAGTFEEINDGIAGSNYGWNSCEGFCNPPNPNFRDPLLAYPHSGGNFNGCAIVGGAFYNPAVQQFPADYSGDYFFADLCRGWIRRYDIGSNTSAQFASGISTPVDLYVSPDGSLYYLARGTGQLVRVRYTGSVPNSPTSTNTRVNTATRTNTPVNTATRTPTRVNTATRTPTNAPIPTNTPTKPPTKTKVPTATFTPENGWIFCARQNQFCAFTGTKRVRFGANNKRVVKRFTDGVMCNIENFGDPLPGRAKICQYR
jgi:glucose/arabinose dehydrogenase